tara:strand:+ start:852 stop:1016 length:165 start_codon:yes stop_codon:yes gene_type:complete
MAVVLITTWRNIKNQREKHELPEIEMIGTKLNIKENILSCVRASCNTGSIQRGA